MPKDQNEIFEDEREHVERPMRRLFTEYGRNHPVPMGIALGSNLLSPLLGLLPAYFLSVAIDSLFTQSQPLTLPLVPDSVLPAETNEQLLLIFGLMIVAYTLNALFTWVGSWGWAAFAERVQHDVRTDAYEKMQGLGMDFFADRQTGELMSILTSDINRLEDFLNGWIGRLLNIAVLIVGVVGIMLSINWQLALVVLLPGPVLAVISYKFVQIVRPKYREARSTYGSLASRLENNLSGIRVVKSFTTEEFEAGRVSASSIDHKNARWSARRWGVRFGPGLTLINGMGLSAVFVVGGYWLMFGEFFVFTGAVTVGTLVLFLQYAERIQGPMSEAGMLLNNYERVKASAERVFVLKDYPTNVPEDDDAIDLTNVTGHVEFDDVSFSYEDADDAELALTNVDFEVKSGQMIGLVGPTGSGKSTLMKLLLRFYDVDEGAVSVDGTDIRKVTTHSLRKSIGYVSQEPFLFTGTVSENIAYGIEASHEEIVDAAKMANAHNFIAELEDGYDSEVGQDGDRLSGGQRQRIALARVVLKDPEIIILDEATSHVDNETEVLIQQSLEELIQDRTTFAIAHRLSTVRTADTIIVLEDGEIVERGPHDELLDEDGLYANLWHVQVGEVDALPDQFIEEAAARDLA